MTNRHKAIDGRYSMSTLATRYAVVYNLRRQPCSRMENIGIATYLSAYPHWRQSLTLRQTSAVPPYEFSRSTLATKFTRTA